MRRVNNLLHHRCVIFIHLQPWKQLVWIQPLQNSRQVDKWSKRPLSLKTCKDLSVLASSHWFKCVALHNYLYVTYLVLARWKSMLCKSKLVTLYYRISANQELLDIISGGTTSALHAADRSLPILAFLLVK